MYNKKAKYIVVLTGLIPIFLVCWIVRIIQSWDQLSFYIKLSSFTDLVEDVQEILKYHWLVILFIAFLYLCKYMLDFVKEKIGAIDVKVQSLKSAEVNFTPLLFTVLAGWLKYYFTDTKDLIFLLGTGVICLAYAITFRDSYHYNLVYKIFFGYRYYEVQINSITYLLITKRMIYNTNEVTSVVKLTDYMIIDVTTY